jgi:hypothetical protein
MEEVASDAVFDGLEVVSVEPIDGEHEVFDITVDVDHAFIVCGAVVHNCTVCGSLDGRQFALDKGPRPPLHIRCRCTSIPWLKDEFAQLMPSRTTRASAGADGGKQVSAGLTFYQWLLLQPPAFQDMALGVTRAKLLREGGLSAARFAALQLDKRFLPMTLAQMKLLEPLAFLAAGIG